jgi:hypothetical protein
LFGEKREFARLSVIMSSLKKTAAILVMGITVVGGVFSSNTAKIILMGTLHGKKTVFRYWYILKWPSSQQKGDQYALCIIVNIDDRALVHWVHSSPG